MYLADRANSHKASPWLPVPAPQRKGPPWLEGKACDGTPPSMSFIDTPRNASPGSAHAMPSAEATANINRVAPLTHDAMESPRRAELTRALAELDMVEQRGQPAVIADALVTVARCYQQLGMTAHRRWYLQQALRFALLLSAVDTSVDVLCELAEASVACTEDLDAVDDDPRRQHSTRDQARDHLYEATRLASRSADPQWEVTVLMRVSDQLDRMGDHDDAIAIQRRALELINRGVVELESVAA